MSGRWRITFLILGMTCLPTSSFAGSSVTANQALALGKNLCTPLISNALTPVRWIVYPANAGSNRKNEKGDYWLVDGQYYPKTPPGVLSVIDMIIWVPKNGTHPEPCSAVSN
jgi:hypothetical protein